MLDEPIVVKYRFLRWVPLFDALVRGESPHPVAQNLLTLYSIIRKNQESVSPVLESVPGRDNTD